MPVFFDAEIQRKIIYQCFGTGEEVTVNELANLVKETVGFTGKINFNDNKPDSTPQKLMDSSRIHNLGLETQDFPAGWIKNGISAFSF